MALTNTWMFLIRQKKYKTRPLLMFYVLTIWLVAMRVYSSFFFLLLMIESDLFGDLLIPILKLNIGLVQCWILFELGLRVTLNIRQTEILQENVG